MDERPQKSYHIGSVGAGAQVAQGENITQTLVQAGVSADELAAAFAPVLEAIAADAELDDDEKEVAADAVNDLAAATRRAAEDPTGLKKALTRAKKLVGGAWGTLVAAMSSDAVQKTLATITEAATAASIKAALGQ